MSYNVMLTNLAANDFEELYEYITDNDSVKKVDYILDKIEEIINSLVQVPERGVVLKELSELGIKEY